MQYCMLNFGGIFAIKTPVISDPALNLSLGIKLMSLVLHATGTGLHLLEVLFDVRRFFVVVVALKEHE